MTKPRVMLVVTHLLGTGHLARIAAIGKALAARGAGVTLVSGGRAAPMVDPTGLEVVQLPPLHCAGTDFRTLLDGGGVVAAQDMLAQRSAMLIETFDRAAPDALVTELYPFGRRALRDEFDALLRHARKARPRPMILASIRDILNPPSHPAKAEAAMRILGAYVDHVLFHGDSAVATLDLSWPVTEPLRRRLIETGYVRDAKPAPPSPRAPSGEILVSAGGSAAGLPLWRAALAAARLRPERRWRLLVGHGVNEADFVALAGQAGSNAIVERARRDFASLLRAADLSISQAGYNTVLDLAAADARALLVPFAEGGEKEQDLRAQALTQRGLASALPQDALSGDRLAQAADAALKEPRPDWSALRGDGAGRSADILLDCCAVARRRSAAWDRLDAALERAKRLRRVLPFWLRDDDATTPSEDLSRFLPLLQRYDIAAAFAVIPAQTQDRLATLLTNTPHAVVTHGWTHANHAPETQKKTEFGAHRDLNVMVDEARRGGDAIARLFREQALPVFVPPWNRVDDSFTRHLTEAGFTGLSTYGRRGGQLSGVMQVNTHWDPVDWKRGGGLAAEDVLINLLARLIGEELDAPEGALEPIGLLTHHLVHDPWIDRFLDEMLARLADSQAVRFLHPREVFATPQTRRR